MPSGSPTVVALSIDADLDHDSATSADRPFRRIASCINSMSVSGGSELNAVRTAEQLAQRGHQVVAVTLTSDTGGMAVRYRAAGIPVHGFPVRSLIGVGAFQQLRRAAKFFRDMDIDIIHAHDCYSNFLMVLAARLAGVPVLASKRWIHQTFPQHRYTDWLAFHLADGVLANSDEVRRTVERAERISTNRITVVPNFLDDDLFGAHAARSEWRSRFGLPDDALVFCIVAQLRPEKNHGLLLEAFALIAREFPTARLLIVGDGPERERIEQAVDRLHLRGVVHMAGYLPRAGLAFSAADVAVLPSQHEGFPNSVIEAMATGTPVIASAVGGIRDALTSGETGLLIPPNDVSALETAMRTLALDPSLRRNLGVRAQVVADSRYRASSVIPRLEQLYTNILGARA